PVTIGVNYLTDADKTLLFVLACAALIPLAWLIGEATEHAAEHTGPGIGGFLNASFGNAPELIIALFAVSSGLPQVVKGSLAGSVISILLLVFGVAQIVGPDGKELDRRSLLAQLGLCGVFVALLIPVVVIGYDGNPNRHGGDRDGQRDPRALARRVRARGRRKRVLHLGRHRRDRRQRRRARRRSRDRACREDATRERDRDLVERAGRASG